MTLCFGFLVLRRFFVPGMIPVIDGSVRIEPLNQLILLLRTVVIRVRAMHDVVGNSEWR